MKKYSGLMVIALVLILVPGCISHTVKPVPLSAVSKQVQQYDPGVLTGRLLVLDPGHGGQYPGAVSENGLREADVNLLVALYLEELLTAAGAQVIMTRAQDADCLPADTALHSLPVDLEGRCHLANQHQADLFISIHHNASNTKEKSYNAVETFYKMEGPPNSYQAARSVHQRLARNLGIKENLVIPGNFQVLRNNHNPALLGEAAYLSNPVTGKLLGTEEFLKTEACCYYLGILDYFSKGVPIITTLEPDHKLLQADRPIITAQVADDPYGAGIDPHAIEMLLDDSRVTPVYLPDQGLLRFQPEGILTNGMHRVSLQVTNLRGNTSQARHACFTIDRPADQIQIRAAIDPAPGDNRSLIMVRALVYDMLGQPVRDGKYVAFTCKGATLRHSYDFTRTGQALTYCTWQKPGKINITAVCEDLSGTAELISSSVVPPLVTGILKTKDTKLPLAQALVVVNDSTTVETNKDGYFAFPCPDTGVIKIHISRDGYIPVTRDLVLLKDRNVCEHLQLAPVQAGLLHGRVIVLDPESGAGGEEPRGRLGTRAAEVNLVVADHLAWYLRSAGARVVITRQDDTPLSPAERVRLANRIQAQLYIIIEHTTVSDPNQNYMYTGHHYQSTSGIRLATQIATEMQKQFTLPLKAVQEDYRYTVMQTGCPAVVVNASLLSHPEAEQRLSCPAHNRKEAYAIYNGIVGYYGADSLLTRELTGQVVGPDGRPTDAALVTLDEYLTVQTEDDGRYCLRLLEPGNHWLKITRGGKVVEQKEVRLE